MANWFHRFLNPHCSHCQQEHEESQICKSCEILKIALGQANDEKNRLLQLIIEKNSPIVESQQKEEFKPLRTNARFTPWSIRKHMLEAEDRKAALLKKEALKEVTTEELEKELDVAESERTELGVEHGN